ncbi:MAG: SDR family NAD(P)-dependent oxidoreductase [Erysipelotrichaceae bacterium]|nr:SDR family NAD(P)-dependent oxidoreductase [Erysipelotrichaceae bacterium]
MEQIHDNQVIVITGAAQGIGLTIARYLNQLGAILAIADINEEAAIKAVNDLPNKNSLAIHCDVTSQESTLNMAKVVLEKFGRIDVLINNAGYFPVKLFSDMNYAEWNKVIDINLNGTFLVTKAVYPIMVKQRRGKIINMASVSGRVGGVGFTHYSASKAAVIGLTKALAKESGSIGITVNAIAPGVIETETTKNVFPGFALKEYTKSVPLGRLGTEADLQGIVSFMCSSGSDYMTGQVLTVDGGYTMI